MAVGMNEMHDTVWYKIVKSPMRQRFIKYVKRPLRLALVKMAERYPPVNEKTLNLSNSFHLHTIWKEHMSHVNNDTRGALLDAAFKIGIAEYDHDIFYRRHFERVLKRLVELVNSGEWVFESGELYEEPYSSSWIEDWSEHSEEEIYQLIIDGKMKPGMYARIKGEKNGN